MFQNCPAEVVEQFWDYINNVPFIRWMISPDRPLVSELPRDSQGKVTIDVTKPPILEKSSFFNQTAVVWQETGKYINLKPNRNPNSEFGKWIREERRRGWNGYVNPNTGMWVTGDHYWMLNYCPMHLVVKRDDGFEMRTTRHPGFWDGQFLLSHYVLQARQNKKHADALASRGKGKTSLGAGMLSKRFEIGEFEDNTEEVQCMVTATDRTKLIGTNQILSVFMDNIDFCAKNTQFASRRLKSSMQELVWQSGYKKSGSDVAYGSKNSVSGIITGVNQDKLNGSRGVLYLIEEAGIFKNLREMYSMIRPSVEQGSSVFGEIYLYGTAGDDQSDFAAFSEMFYSPDGYNLYGIENVYDKEGQGGRYCGFFYPAYMNYDDTCIDENGNSDVTKALLMICYDRYKVKYGSSDINTLTKRISQYPVTPQEAIIRSRGNMFPVTELNNRLNQLDNNPNEYDDVYVGELYQDKDGSVEFKPTGDMPIRDFPTDDNKVLGALEIYEMPQKNSEGKIPYDRYGFGCLKEGEMVNTEDGLKRVEDITLQDRLINIEGRFVDIINLQRYYNENPVYKVKLFSVYNSTTFSEEHPIYCATPKIRYHHASIAKREGVPYRYLTYDFQFRKVKDLKVGDVVKSPNVYRKEKSFMQYWVDEARVDRKIENPLDKGGFWWLLGLIIGDGWASKDGCNIHICFNAREKQYIEQAKYIVENLLGRSFTLAKDRETCIEYQFCCQTLNAFIKKHIGCGAGNKQLAEWIKYIPEVLKKQLILGYLASDGSVTGNQVEFVSISLKLLCDMQDILFSIGIVSGVSRMKHYKQKEIVGNAVKQTKEKYHLRVDRTHAQIMKAWNPDDLKLSRCAAIELCVAHNYKRVWISDDLNYIYFKVASVEIEPYIGTVYNFECSTHTFMCNYIPTHNCDPFDDDESGTMSLGSIFVMDFWTDRIVAEYTGRPPFANDLYEKVRLLCLFYNMKGLYENNLKGIFSYFSMRNCTYMLADTPEYLRDRQLITSIGYGNKGKGCRATTPIIKAGFRMIRDWLLKPVTRIEQDAQNNEVEVTVPNLYNIRCRALLKELIQWNPYNNFDRCVLGDTQIQTTNGIKKIKDITLGDPVLTVSGEYNNVCQLHRNPFSGTMYRFRAMGDYRLVNCTYNHPIACRHREVSPKGKDYMRDRNKLSAPEYKEAQYITRDDFLLIPKRANLPPCLLSDDKLYLLGWYIADGNVSSGNNVMFSLQEDQYEIAKEIKRLLNKYWARDYTFVEEKTRQRKDSTIIQPAYNRRGHVEARIFKSYTRYKGDRVHCWNVCIASKDAQEFFITYGGGPNNKDIAESLYNTKGLMPLIRGLFEGDGHYRCDVRCDGSLRNSLELSSIYEKLIHKVRQILVDEGIWSTVRKIKKRGLMSKEQYSLNIVNKHVIPIIEGSLKFKQVVPKHSRTTKENYFEDDWGFWVKPKDIAFYEYSGDVYNIGVENDHSYCANGIATHNCMALVQLMLYREEKMILYQGDMKRQETKSTGIAADSYWTRNYHRKDAMWRE